MTRLMLTCLLSMAALTLVHVLVNALRGLGQPVDLSALPLLVQRTVHVIRSTLPSLVLSIAAVLAALVIVVSYLTDATTPQARDGLRAFVDSAPVASQVALGLAVLGAALIFGDVARFASRPLTPHARRVLRHRLPHLARREMGAMTPLVWVAERRVRRRTGNGS